MDSMAARRRRYSEPLAGLRVEQMDRVEIRRQREAVARLRRNPLPEHAHDLLAAELGENLGLRAGRFNHRDLGPEVASGERQVLGANAVDARAPVCPARNRFEGQFHTGLRQERRLPVDVDRPLQEVHRRRADESCDEQRRRPIIEVERRPDLLNDAVAHDDDAIGHRHRLDLVVRHVDRRCLQPLVQLLDLGAHLHAQLGVEIRKRLVEEEHLRIAHDRPPHRDALTLAAGELARITRQVGRNVQDFRGAPHPGLDLRLGRAPQLQPEAHVLGDRLVRIERIVLKDHRNVAVFRGEIVDDALPDPDLSVPDRLQARNHPQQRRFAAAGRPDQSHEFAVRDRDRYAMNHLDAAVSLADVDNVDRSHFSPPGAKCAGVKACLLTVLHPFRGVEALAPLRPARSAGTTCANRRRRVLGRRSPNECRRNR